MTCRLSPASRPYAAFLYPKQGEKGTGSTPDDDVSLKALASILKDYRPEDHDHEDEASVPAVPPDQGLSSQEPTVRQRPPPAPGNAERRTTTTDAKEGKSWIGLKPLESCEV